MTTTCRECGRELSLAEWIVWADICQRCLAGESDPATVASESDHEVPLHEVQGPHSLCGHGEFMNDQPQGFSFTGDHPQNFSIPNPFPALKAEIEKHVAEIKHDVRVAVETEMLRESVRFFLSRLIALDPKRAAEYESALKLL